MFIAAILTIIGYSINDTIVTFDRIRSNYNKDKIKQVATNLSKNLGISKGEQNYETKKRKTCIRQCCQNHQR